jgi:hypothetical protein
MYRLIKKLILLLVIISSLGLCDKVDIVSYSWRRMNSSFYANDETDVWFTANVELKSNAAQRISHLYVLCTFLDEDKDQIGSSFPAAGASLKGTEKFSGSTRLARKDISHCKYVKIDVSGSVGSGSLGDNKNLTTKIVPFQLKD